MGKLIKRLTLLVVVMVVLAGAFGVYVAVVAGVNIPGLTNAFRAEPVPPSAEVLAKAQQVELMIEGEVSDNSAFLLRLTNEDLTSLIQAEAGQAASVVRDLKVAINTEEVTINGALNGRIGIPFSGAVGVTLNRGVVQLEIKRLNVTFVGLPGAVEEELQPLIDEILDVNELLSSSTSFQIQQVELAEGVITIAGVQTGGQIVSDVTLENLSSAYGNPTTVPEPPGDDVVPVGRTGGEAGNRLYMALGDSLAANVGASRPEAGYVSRFHGYLENEMGVTLGLRNLGVSGESSSSIYNTQLPAALQELNSIRNDGNPATRVEVLTIDLGANDVLGHLGSADCQQDIRGERCSARIDAGIETFGDNFGDILDQLSAALEADARFIVVKMYNPFDFGIGIPFEADSNEVIEQLNDIIEQEAERVGAELADPFTIMAGKAGVWTNMLSGDIHPNDDGFQAMAYSLTIAEEP